MVWATDLRTGAPVADAGVSIVGGDSGVTDVEGLASLDLPPSTSTEPVLVATNGDDSAILPLQAYRQDLRDESRWYVFDDRQVYRPGETMRVKGWVRRLTLSGDAQLKAIDPDATVGYVVNDSYGNELLQGTANLGALGGFDLELQLPDTANLGAASLMLTLNGESGLEGTSTWHQFQIEEYRRPEFEVTTRPESDEPFLSTQPATIAATGEYYAGGPLANAPANWSVSTTPTTYAPPADRPRRTRTRGTPGSRRGAGGQSSRSASGSRGGSASSAATTTATTAKAGTTAMSRRAAGPSTTRRSSSTRASPMAPAPTTCSWASRPPTARCPTCRWQ